ncbi:MAG: type II toxin-antitoxin system prevent-host-death family antitoxin [bacterium]
MSIKSVSVAEAKRSFSELMTRVVYKDDEYIVERRGRPMVAIIKPEYLNLLHSLNKKQERKGLISIVGKFDDAQNFVKEVERVYSLREKSKDREVIL